MTKIVRKHVHIKKIGCHEPTVTENLPYGRSTGVAVSIGYKEHRELPELATFGAYPVTHNDSDSAKVSANDKIRVTTSEIT